jgi:hypothetical protein
MRDPVGEVLERLDRPVRPRREFEEALLQSLLASLSGAQRLPASEAADIAEDGGQGGAPPPVRAGVVWRWTGWGRGTAHVRWRTFMVGIGTAALLSGMLGASLRLGQRGQVGPAGEVSGSAPQTATARYLGVLRADYPTLAADVQRIGVRCVTMPSPDLQLCRTYVLELRTASQAMRDHLLASALPPTLAANDGAIRRDLDELLAGADAQLSNIAAGSIRCCPVDDANGHLHDDVFAALGVASSRGTPTG